MVMNRRLMLQASCAAIGLTLSGCKKKTKTVVVFKNNFTSAMSVDATAGSFKFKKGPIAPGGSATETYHTKDSAGTVVALTGTATAATTPPTVTDLSGRTITAGKKNTFTVDATGAITSVVS